MSDPPPDRASRDRASRDRPPRDRPPPGDLRADPFREGPAAARARRGRSLAIALALAAFVALVFVNTIIRLSSNIRENARQHPSASQPRRPVAAP